jgi:hypothetical protein
MRVRDEEWHGAATFSDEDVRQLSFPFQLPGGPPTGDGAYTCDWKYPVFNLLDVHHLNLTEIEVDPDYLGDVRPDEV